MPDDADKTREARGLAWFHYAMTQPRTGMGGPMVKVASNDFCANAALLYDDRAFTLQAHPEFQPAFIDGLMRTRGKGLVPDEVMANAAEKLKQPLQDRTIAAQIAAFFKTPRAKRPVETSNLM